MKNDREIFREAEERTQKRYKGKIIMANYGDLMIAGGFMREGQGS